MPKPISLIDQSRLPALANCLRFLAADAVQNANSGHPGLPMGLADAMAVLFCNYLRFDPLCPKWANRDRFVLSAGHGVMLQYALLHLLGYRDMSLDQLKRFRQLNSLTPGHPEFGHSAGIETTTGPLGQGLANAVGMAITETMLRAQYGDTLIDYSVVAVVGDGCLMEGISQEAIDLAGQLELNKLIVCWDDNRITIDGPTSLATKTEQADRFRASGWEVLAPVDSYDASALHQAYATAFTRSATKPLMIPLVSTIGYGAPHKAGTAQAHGAPLGIEELAQTRANLNWEHAPFAIPDTLSTQWRTFGQRHQKERQYWETIAPAPLKRADKSCPRACTDALIALARQQQQQTDAIATRKASEHTLNTLLPHAPHIVGGSADLSGSNNTFIPQMGVYHSQNRSGRYIHYGVREHAMAAVMNGITLTSPMIPYGGTFLVFSDYLRPALRLCALMQQQVIFVLTHDSIGLGEDGPTHQPVETLASLRAIPNLRVYRPADAAETTWAWLAALRDAKHPSVLALSRQSLPPLPCVAHESENPLARGGYITVTAENPEQLCLIATGSEVGLAVAAAQELAQQNIHARVVSMPCVELFLEQSSAYQQQILGDAPRIVVEAGVKFGWERLLRESEPFIGMRTFGASAPAQDLFAHFGLTVDAIVTVGNTVLRQRQHEHKRDR